MKIYNQTGGHGFYFSAGQDPADRGCGNGRGEISVESGWMAEQLANNGELAWFTSGDNVKLERTMITRAWARWARPSTLRQGVR